MWTSNKIKLFPEVLFYFAPPFSLSVDSAHNCQVFARVSQEIYHYVGGEAKCQWSDAQIEGKV